MILGVLHFFNLNFICRYLKIECYKNCCSGDQCGQGTHVLRVIAVCRLLTLLHLRIENYELHCQFDVLNSRLVTKSAMISGALYSCKNYNQRYARSRISETVNFIKF